MYIKTDTSYDRFSLHKDYKDFLFEQFGKAIPLNYNKVTEACCCVESNLSVIYERNKSEDSHEKQE